MKTILLWLAMGVAFVLAISANAVWWIWHPDTPLNFSNPLWKWAKRMYGVTTAYQESDLAFLMSSAAIALGFIAIMLAYRHWRKRRGTRRLHS
ncbi:hypothetical protein [Paraburkholderia sp. ZP32-5]|uniref:hypothetical protein n=1 Tax=Paraburkholderia sp. ZP32-5 TaxID=2883245 RepID=UPI001F46848A|nr:hypothetical protein [Paraburkholderia sp. ZP32-5]